jgi:hypothetical protein
VARHVLRLVAMAIALAGVTDPVLTRTRPEAPRLSIVILDAESASRDDGDEMRRQRLHASADALRSRLAPDYDARIVAHATDSAASACGSTGGCLVVSDGAQPRHLSSGATVVGAVRVDPSSSDVMIAGVDLPRRIHLHGAGVMQVQLRARRAHGDTHVQVFDDDVLVGSAIHTWGAAGDDALVPAAVPVEWVPIAEGPRRLRIVISAGPDQAGLLDGPVDVGVDVHAEPAPVVMYEPEASWLGTFVRRAIDADPRVALRAWTRVAPGLAIAAAAGAPLTPRTLAESSTVVVAAPDALTGDEVALLDQFVRRRGGSVVLLPDRRPTGAVTRLMPPIVAERRLSEPLAVGPLRASELLMFDDRAAGVRVLASAGEGPVVVERAIGRGRVVVSGALDAWRFRDEPFAGFWSSLIADATAAAGHTLEVVLEKNVLGPGERSRVTVEWRTRDAIGSDLVASAVMQCAGEAEQPIRLWPEARRGTFVGVVSSETAGACEVRASLLGPAPVAGAARFVTAPGVRRPIGTAPGIETAVAAHGGITVAAGDEAALGAHVRETIPAIERLQETRPMRSPWWMLPFAGCLGAEWWLRRRGGLR